MQRRASRTPAQDIEEVQLGQPQSPPADRQGNRGRQADPGHLIAGAGQDGGRVGRQRVALRTEVDGLLRREPLVAANAITIVSMFDIPPPIC
jgi:hypothetical protein